MNMDDSCDSLIWWRPASDKGDNTRTVPTILHPTWPPWSPRKVEKLECSMFQIGEQINL